MYQFSVFSIIIIKAGWQKQLLLFCWQLIAVLKIMSISVDAILQHCTVMNAMSKWCDCF